MGCKSTGTLYPIDKGTFKADVVGIGLTTPIGNFMLSLNTGCQGSFIWNTSTTDTELTNYQYSMMMGTNSYTIGYLYHDGVANGLPSVSAAYQTWSAWGTNSVLSDFSGIDNSAIIKTNSTQSSEMGYQLNLFDTNFDNSLDRWYIPSMAQLAYIYFNKEEINEYLEDTAEENGMIADAIYWSSNEYNLSYAWTFDMSLGFLTSKPKTSYCLVRFVRDF